MVKPIKRIDIRESDINDWPVIAEIHTQNWQQNYRGILSDDYLDNEVEHDRKTIWSERVNNPSNNQKIYIAQCDNKIIGFSCAYHHYKKKSEHYLDNLHVTSAYQGYGIGARLLHRSATWANDVDSTVPFFLLVYDRNEKAKRFYKRCGADVSKPFLVNNPDGSQGEVVRCTWENVMSIKI